MPDRRSEKDLPVIRPHRRTGREFRCVSCGKKFYRRGSQIARGITKTCGGRACISESMRGGNNPFWGKDHTPETRALIAASKQARTPPHKRHKHPRQRVQKPREKQRYRYCFTGWQRKNWTDKECLWCGSTDDLVLDHIISVMCGGINERKNAQTLCMPCNRWKLKYVDRPLFLAGLGNQRG